jgi:hypothetical protein
MVREVDNLGMEQGRGPEEQEARRMDMDCSLERPWAAHCCHRILTGSGVPLAAPWARIDRCSRCAHLVRHPRMLQGPDVVEKARPIAGPEGQVEARDPDKPGRRAAGELVDIGADHHMAAVGGTPEGHNSGDSSGQVAGRAVRLVVGVAGYVPSAKLAEAAGDSRAAEGWGMERELEGRR